MSGIISDPAFNNMFTATRGDNTMQATVTAVYEVGRAPQSTASSPDS
jgi:fructose-1,6-bisphosphatase/inositol monophosphatase family enzyme